MNAIVYQNTRTNIPGWINTVHETQSIGFAYEYNNYFTHIYGMENGFWVMSTGLTASQQSNGDIKHWVESIFGAENIRPSKNLVGKVVKSVWRPGLYYEDEVHQAFSVDQHEQQNSEQALRILMEKLNDLLLYIEPSEHGGEVIEHTLTTVVYKTKQPKICLILINMVQ